LLGALLCGTPLIGVADAQMPTPGAPTIGPTMRPPSDQQAPPPPGEPGAARGEQEIAAPFWLRNDNPHQVT
jgi:hypothetical protein